MGKWGTLNVLGQPAEPICNYYGCHHQFSLHGSWRCRCKHPTNKALGIQVSYQDCIYNGYLCKAGSTEHACELPLTEEKPAIANDCILVPSAPGCGTVPIPRTLTAIPPVTDPCAVPSSPECKKIDPCAVPSSIECAESTEEVKRRAAALGIPPPEPILPGEMYDNTEKEDSWTDGEVEGQESEEVNEEESDNEENADNEDDEEEAATVDEADASGDQEEESAEEP